MQKESGRQARLHLLFGPGLHPPKGILDGHEIRSGLSGDRTQQPAGHQSGRVHQEEDGNRRLEGCGHGRWGRSCTRGYPWNRICAGEKMKITEQVNISLLLHLLTYPVENFSFWDCSNLCDCFSFQFKAVGKSPMTSLFVMFYQIFIVSLMLNLTCLTKCNARELCLLNNMMNHYNECLRRTEDCKYVKREANRHKLYKYIY